MTHAQIKSKFLHYFSHKNAKFQNVFVLHGQIEDGWWMGKKNNQIGAFPSNFVKEIFVPLKGDVH